MDNNLAELWTRYTKYNDRQAREALILHYANLVKYVVSRLLVRLPPSLEDNDLISCGLVGLIEAVDRFDPAHGVKFQTYAVARIRGQVIDSLRALDLLPRSAYRRTREIETAIARLSQSLRRHPTDAEVADHLCLSLDEYQNWLLNANFTIVSLDQPLTFEDGQEANLYDSLEDTTVPRPSDQAANKEVKADLVSAIRALPEREQLMISLYYNQGVTMKEIGRVLGVSESRVSQMHAKTMLTLRGFMNSLTEQPPLTYNRKGSNAPVCAAAR